MAVDFSSPHTRTSEYLFAPEDIEVRPELNGRHDPPKLEQRIRSILLVGQLQPVIVRNEGGRAVLVAGYTRWRAISEINRKKLVDVPLKVRAVYQRLNEQSGFLANIHENVQREGLGDLDRAHAMAKLEQWGIPREEIGDHFNTNALEVARLLKLAELSPEAEKALREGRLKTPAALAIAKLSAEQQRKVLKGTDGKITTGAIHRFAETAAGSENGSGGGGKARGSKPSKSAKWNLQDIKSLLDGLRTSGTSALPKGMLVEKPSDKQEALLVDFAVALLERIEGKAREQARG